MWPHIAYGYLESTMTFWSRLMNKIQSVVRLRSCLYIPSTVHSPSRITFLILNFSHLLFMQWINFPFLQSLPIFLVNVILMCFVILKELADFVWNIVSTFARIWCLYVITMNRQVPKGKHLAAFRAVRSLHCFLGNLLQLAQGRWKSRPWVLTVSECEAPNRAKD